ncbi:structural protein [Vibrio algicola]|uniref:Phage Mu protein F like protein n=1 Tax=Vibrio algicola TaxID=2662262 RepID=A0A5Q0TIM9_9VIBR|nr:hypothetical protein [Vibrio algicola]
MAKNLAFDSAFDFVCKQLNVPSAALKSLHKILSKNINDRRNALKQAIEILPYNWMCESISPILIGNKKDDISKNHIDFLVFRIISLTRVNEQWDRIHRTKRVMPNLLLQRGTFILDCAIHEPDNGKVFSVDDEYWTTHPLNEDLTCNCSIRQLSRHEHP